MLEIVPFTPKMASALARCYNELAAEVPHCYPISRKIFAGMERLACLTCRKEVLLAAKERGRIRGFVHAGVSGPPRAKWNPKDKTGVIRFLCYRPGERHIGAALLEAAERWIRRRSRPEIAAWHYAYRYPFYHFPNGLLSDRLGHIHSLFGMAGYKVSEGEVFFDWHDFRPPRAPKPSLDFELLVEWREEMGHSPCEYGRKGVILKIVSEGRWLGQCEMLRFGKEMSRPEAAEWCYCHNLEVDKSVQGRGLGKFLLARGLAEMKRAGCRHASICTNRHNHRAYLFYTNLGFKFSDRTVGFRKKL
jgi:GNAT superfamily N-acetyltransferase